MKRFSVNGTSIKFREFLRAFYTSSSGASGKTEALEVRVWQQDAVVVFVVILSSPCVLFEATLVWWSFFKSISLSTFSANYYLQPIVRRIRTMLGSNAQDAGRLLKRAFADFDLNGNGKLSKNEFNSAMVSLKVRKKRILLLISPFSFLLLITCVSIHRLKYLLVRFVRFLRLTTVTVPAILTMLASYLCWT